MTDHPTPTLYTAPQMADALGFSPQAIYLQIKNRDMAPAMEAGRIKLYSPEQLEELRGVMDPKRREEQPRLKRRRRATRHGRN